MKGRGTLNHIIALASKKPKVKYLLDHYSDMTLDEINSQSDVSGWIKKVLLKERGEVLKRPPGALTPGEIALRMVNYTPD